MLQAKYLHTLFLMLILPVFAACTGSTTEEGANATQVPGAPGATQAVAANETPLPPLADLMHISKLKLRTEVSSALEKHNFTYDKTTPQGTETTFSFIRTGGDNINYVTNNADRSMVEYTTTNPQLYPFYKAEVAKHELKAIDCQLNSTGLTVECFESSEYYIIIAKKTTQAENGQSSEMYSVMVNH